MKVEPVFSARKEQRYAGLRAQISRDQLAEVAPQSLAQVAAFLAGHGIAVTGPPIVRYLVVDYNTEGVEIDVGVIVEASDLPDDPEIRLGKLPAGTYASVVHSGPYDGLVETTAAFLEWAKHSGVAWAVQDDHNVTHWAARVERYLVGPPLETSVENWRTEIAILMQPRGSGAATSPRSALSGSP